jgi:hypothetical protein
MLKKFFFKFILKNIKFLFLDMGINSEYTSSMVWKEFWDFLQNPEKYQQQQIEMNNT